MVISNSKYNGDTHVKQPLPLGKGSLVRGAEMQDAILPDGTKKRLLVLAEDQDRHKDFVMSFRNRGEDTLMIDPGALGIFHYLATTYMDYKNTCQITAKDLAERVGKSVPVIKKWLNELIENGYAKRLKLGMYMLSPYHTIQVRKRYFGIIERAWITGDVSKVRADMARLDEESRRETTRNKKLVKKAEASIVAKKLTVPEAPIVALDEESEYQYIQTVKEEEIEARTAERIAQKLKKQGQRQLQ